MNLLLFDVSNVGKSMANDKNICRLLYIRLKKSHHNLLRSKAAGYLTLAAFVKWMLRIRLTHRSQE